jgi:L-lactate dehydrogenase complex protein LldE
MLNVHYPRLFDGDPRLPLVQEFADKVLELTCFLERFLPENYHIDNTGDMPFQPVAYHHSCSGLRELGIKQQPKTLLERCCNLTPLEVTDADVCCGFGGTFCVKFAEISNRLVSEKCANITAASNMLSGGDLPCLLHIVGKSLHGGQAAIKARHIAELLAGDYRSPAIGEGDG